MVLARWPASYPSRVLRSVPSVDRVSTLPFGPTELERGELNEEWQ